jgi:hypothetical protein
MPLVVLDGFLAARDKPSVSFREMRAAGRKQILTCCESGDCLAGCLSALKILHYANNFVK